MDISDQLGGGGFVKPHHLLDGPRRAIIAGTAQGRFGVELDFEDGSKFGLNQTNLRKLADAWGVETDLWIGKEVELYIGKIRHPTGEERDGVLIRPISPPLSMAERPKPKPRQDVVKDMNDEIPF